MQEFGIGLPEPGLGPVPASCTEILIFLPFPMMGRHTHSLTSGPKGSLILPSTMMLTRLCRVLARQNMSFCEAAPPPGRLTLCSGIAKSNSTSSSAGIDSRASLISLGKPSASSQRYASAYAECPFFPVQVRFGQQLLPILRALSWNEYHRFPFYSGHENFRYLIFTGLNSGKQRLFLIISAFIQTDPSN